MVDDVSTLDQIRTVVSIVRNLASLGQEAKSKGLDVKHAENLNRAIMDLQNAVLDAQNDALVAQQEQFRQATRIIGLEQMIAEFENWETEKARYKLVDVGSAGGVFVFLLRPEASYEDEPPHFICPNCYQKRIKSILQRSIRPMRGTFCPECNTTFVVNVDFARSHGVMR